MTLWAVSMCKDEADVIEGTLRHLADEGCDGIIVADNGSTDGTRDILDGLKLDCELVVVDDPDPAYFQSSKMSALAGIAGARGATWVIPFDADEVWYAPDQMAATLEESKADVVAAELFNHFPSAIDPPAGHPFETIQWRQPFPAPLPKVAFRWHPGAVISQGNHGVNFQDDHNIVTETALAVRHFPYRTVEQFINKARNGAAAYAATDLPENQGAHWRQYGALMDTYGPEVLGDVFREHFWHLAPVEAGLIHDPAPYMRWP